MAIKLGKYDKHGHHSVIFIQANTLNQKFQAIHPEPRKRSEPVDNHEITLVHNSVAYHLSALETVIDIDVG